MRASARAIAWAGGALLLLLHLDFWRDRRLAIHFQWIPEELLYRFGWMALAFVYLIFFCRFVWTDEDPSGEEDA